MSATPHGTKVPARKFLLACLLLSMVGVPVARADDGMVDVRTLPRLAGAVEDTSHTRPDSLNYGVSTVVAITSVATRQLLAADGWVPYIRPGDEKSSSLTFKKAQQGLNVLLHARPRPARPIGGVLFRRPHHRQRAVPA